jgi:hypothetical protein
MTTNVTRSISTGMLLNKNSHGGACDHEAVERAKSAGNRIVAMTGFLEATRRGPARSGARSSDNMGSFLADMLKQMKRFIVLLLIAVETTVPVAQPADSPAVNSVCEVSRDYAKVRDELVAIRGVYYYGLREECEQKCASGLWPSFINLEGGREGVWNDLAKTANQVEREAKATGKRFEIWVTVIGRLQTRAKPSRRGPCDKKSWGLGYGHLNVFPAQITVDSFRDVEVKVNPRSPYDYANMYHGPA